MQLELRTDNDDRTARVVNALSEQVLTETSLLALEQIAKRLEGAVTGAGYGTATTTIVEQSVNCFLEHALFVVENGLWNLSQFNESL